MRTWISSLLDGHLSPSTRGSEDLRLGVTARRRDAVVHRAELARNQSFTVGRSWRCSMPLETPALPHARFVLAQCRGGKAQIHITDAMSGALHYRGEHLTLSHLRELCALQPHPLLQESPSGHRLTLPHDASLHLCFDGWLLQFAWQPSAHDTPRHWPATMGLFHHKQGISLAC